MAGRLVEALFPNATDLARLGERGTVITWWRAFRGLCPECASKGPEAHDCQTCRGLHRKYFRLRWTLSDRAALLRGYFRHLAGVCPACNSDAPEIDGCQVCGGHRFLDGTTRQNIEERLWWRRFVVRVRIPGYGR